MTFKWQISSSENAYCLQLAGDLTRSTLLPLWQQRTSLFQTQKSCLEMKLNQLGTVDSAGFVLICEILHRYSELGEVKLVDVPHLVLDFAELYDLDQWLKAFIQP
ncbi:STAS domain-containing protein [Pasteurellaceae bacterium USgator11]|nr:STAS domain-containing protein [Pasteurellaceae bacterium USgator41]TNG95629.1 STAS domain-containing protein [Pasteurellaceae bacterium UScroc12]TNH00612.1 STAS domain-containing protein [Pasteurellaceae bacterium USgator11]TNH01177.1 STAS domain-containing protein [Pasteurellaceae bacterium UScroc31]